MGDLVLFSQGTSYSARAMILFYKFSGKILKYKGNSDGQWLMIVIEIFDCRFIPINVFEYDSRSLSRNMMLNLSQEIGEWKAAGTKYRIRF